MQEADVDKEGSSLKEKMLRMADLVAADATRQSSPRALAKTCGLTNSADSSPGAVPYEDEGEAYLLIRQAFADAFHELIEQVACLLGSWRQAVIAVAGIKAAGCSGASIAACALNHLTCNRDGAVSRVRFMQSLHGVTEDLFADAWQPAGHCGGPLVRLQRLPGPHACARGRGLQQCHRPVRPHSRGAPALPFMPPHACHDSASFCALCVHYAAVLSPWVGRPLA